MTLTGRPPMVTRRRDCAAGLARLRPGSSASAAAAVTVLKKPLRVGMPRPSSLNVLAGAALSGSWSNQQDR